MDLISVGRVVITLATVTAYIIYFVWRVRSRRAQQANPATRANPAATAAATPEDRLARTIAAAARLSGEPPKVDEGDASATPPPSTPTAPLDGGSSMPPPAPSIAPAIAVADLLRGIELPNDLTPLTTMAPRVAARDRVAFWTNTSVADVVEPAFLDALRAIGCQVAPLGLRTYALERDGAHAMVNTYADGRAAIIDGRPGYPSVPENSFVIEIWTSS